MFTFPPQDGRQASLQHLCKGAARVRLQQSYDCNLITLSDYRCKKELKLLLDDTLLNRYLKSDFLCRALTHTHELCINTEVQCESSEEHAWTQWWTEICIWWEFLRTSLLFDACQAVPCSTVWIREALKLGQERHPVYEEPPHVNSALTIWLDSDRQTDTVAQVEVGHWVYSCLLQSSWSVFEQDITREVGV